ncbi:MAG TPA: transporter [Actinospica sp.]|nr:transporter [Actinospica sp.]
MAKEAVGSNLLASGEHSAPVTQLAARLGLTVLILAAFAGLCWLMWRGYQRRAARQADLPAPATAAPSPVEGDEGVEGVYASTTTHGDWLDRIAAHGLGVRSNADVTVTGEGVFFARQAAPDLFIPAADVVGAELAPGIAGKVTGGEGVVLITWRLGERTLDTGFHPRLKAARLPLVEAVNALGQQKKEVAA